MLQGRRIAVTGATGFVARYLMAELSAQGAEVIGLSRGTADLGDTIRSFATDYSADSLKPALQGCDAVMHLAGRRMTHEDNQLDPDPFFAPNVLATGALFDAAAEAGAWQFVFASTIAIYGPSCPMPYQEAYATQPLNAYAATKRMAEVLLEQKSKGCGMNVTSLRLAAIYGYGEKGTPALMRFVGQAEQGETLKLTGNRNYCIDQLYVRDATRAFMTALNQSEGYQVLNIGGGQQTRVEDIAKTVNDVFANEGKLDSSGAADGPANATYMQISKADALIGWKPKYTLDAGLRDFRETRDR